MSPHRFAFPDDTSKCTWKPSFLLLNTLCSVLMQMCFFCSSACVEFTPCSPPFVFCAQLWICDKDPPYWSMFSSTTRQNYSLEILLWSYRSKPDMETASDSSKFRNYTFLGVVVCSPSRQRHQVNHLGAVCQRMNDMSANRLLHSGTRVF